MKWDFYCSKGSASFVFDGTTPYQRGVGGAEMGLINLAEALAARGNDVTVWNSPPHETIVNGVHYRDVAGFDHRAWRDVFVLFRNPMRDVRHLRNVNARIKVFWSCDQFTEGNYAADVFPYVDRVVTISTYHSQYFNTRYGLPIERTTPIDLMVRTWEYARDGIERMPRAMLYCSVPDRGLAHLLRLFPRIRERVADATLWVTSDYSLWGEGIAPCNERFRRNLPDGVIFFGKVPRHKLVELQMQASVMAYPNTAVGGLYELFCLSAAECQVAGCIPVTSSRGALTTTVIGGVLIDGEPGCGNYDDMFVEAVSAFLSQTTDDLAAYRDVLRQLARERFGPERIVRAWQQVLA
jgi:glycosyltransferase involved in cell wall biosynthesis